MVDGRTVLRCYLLLGNLDEHTCAVLWNVVSLLAPRTDEWLLATKP